MEIQQLKGFLAVANYQSFTAAAEKTFRTQPAVSLQIQALEEELGVKLIERIGTRKLQLAPEGELLRQLASPLLEDFESLKARFDEARGSLQGGAVTIATHGSVMAYLLPDVIKQFKTSHPECQLAILHRSREEIVSLASHGEADLGITSLRSIPNNLEYHLLAHFSRVLIASRTHPLGKKRTISLQDIAQYPLILPTRETNTRTIIEKVFEDQGLTPTVAMEVAGREAVKTYVELDLGIAIMNQYYLTKEDRKKLAVKDVSEFFGKAERGVIIRKGKYLSVPVKAFLQELNDHFEPVGRKREATLLSSA